MTRQLKSGFVIFKAAILFTFLNGYSTTYYVATNGNDSNPGTSEDKPFRTIQKAADMVSAGDTVRIKAGVYRTSQINIRNGGTASQPVVFMAHGDGNVLVDGSNSQHHVFYFTSPDVEHVHLIGLEIAYAPSTGVKELGRYGKILNCDIHHNLQQGIQGAKEYTEIIGNRIHHNGDEYRDGQYAPGNNKDHGVYINKDHVKIMNNLIYENQAFGLHLYPQINNSIISNNTIWGNKTRRGILIYGGTGNIIQNNICYGNGTGGIVVEQATGNIIRNNLCFENGGPQYEISGGNTVSNNLEANPGFVDYPSDVRLKSGSPAIDAGNSQEAPKNDIEGNSRPQNQGFDIGAYEYAGSKQNTSPKAKIIANVLGGEAPLVVDFDGSQSTDPDGFIQNYIWNFGDGQTSQAQNPPPHTFASAGQYLVTLAVTDNSGAIGRDSLKVSVVAPGTYTYIYLEAEGGNINSPMQIGRDSSASSGAYIYTPAGTGNATSPTAEARYQIELANSGLYYLWIRTYAPGLNHDATYVGFNGSYVRIFPQNTKVYEWVKAGDAYDLNAGPNQINIGHGEEQARVDRLLTTNDPNFIPKATNDPPTASIVLSDPSPTKAGQVQVILTTSNVVTKLPTPLIFTESDNSTTQIDLSGSLPGDTFTGIFVVDETVADGIGYFALPADALIDVNGIKGNEINSGAFVRIDKTPPANPKNVKVDFSRP
jgi:parallel beta-helix repeat protein